jgi:hypothetical protein
MKLTASILIASAHAQTRGRDSKDTDNENTDAAAFGDAFADYFGGYDYGGLSESFDYSGFDDQAFGNYNDAFGTDAPATNAPTAAPTVAATAAPTFAATEDPFAGYDFSGADDSFASYDGADDSAALDDTVADIVADVIDAAGRPDGDDSEDGKSSAFIQQPVAIEASVDLSQYASYCFVGTAEATIDIASNKPVSKPDPGNAEEAWFANGAWHHCAGENEVCQIKVTRSRNEIFSIVSKCANNESCVDNMTSNYAPHWSPSGSQIFAKSWSRQKCRPTFGFANLQEYNGSNNARARGGVPSECFYCLEPCRAQAAAVVDVDWAAGAMADAAAVAAEMKADFCVGRGANAADDGSFGDNAIAFGTFNVFDEGTWNSAVAESTWDTSVRIDGALLTNPLTLTRTDVHGAAETYTTQVSNIQIEQIQQRIAMTPGEAADLPDLVAGAGASK